MPFVGAHAATLRQASRSRSFVAAVREASTAAASVRRLTPSAHASPASVTAVTSLTRVHQLPTEVVSVAFDRATAPAAFTARSSTVNCAPGAFTTGSSTASSVREARAAPRAASLTTGSSTVSCASEPRVTSPYFSPARRETPQAMSPASASPDRTTGLRVTGLPAIASPYFSRQTTSPAGLAAEHQLRCNAAEPADTLPNRDADFTHRVLHGTPAQNSSAADASLTSSVCDQDSTASSAAHHVSSQKRRRMSTVPAVPRASAAAATIDIGASLAPAVRRRQRSALGGSAAVSASAPSAVLSAMIGGFRVGDSSKENESVSAAAERPAPDAWRAAYNWAGAARHTVICSALLDLPSASVTQSTTMLQTVAHTAGGGGFMLTAAPRPAAQSSLRMLCGSVSRRTAAGVRETEELRSVSPEASDPLLATSPQRTSCSAETGAMFPGID